MPKASKTKNAAKEPRSFYTAQLWKCHHHATRSEITAYVEASGTWETIATVNTTAGVSAEQMAQFICSLINDNQKNKNLLREAMEALELCLEEEGLTFSSEQMADKVVANIKKRVS